MEANKPRTPKKTRKLGNVTRETNASKEFINTKESRERYLDFAGYQRARAGGRTTHDGELLEVHKHDVAEPMLMRTDQIHLHRHGELATDRRQPLDEATVTMQQQRRTAVSSSDYEAGIQSRLRMLFNRIRNTGFELSRASVLRSKGEIKASEHFDDIVTQALDRHHDTKKLKGAGFENEVALLRSHAWGLEVRERRRIIERTAGGGGVQSTVSKLHESDIDFIVMADLAAYLHVTGVKMQMTDVEQLWELLVEDTGARPPHKLGFDDFVRWLDDHHPKLKGVQRVVLTSFATDESFLREFRFEEAMVQRLDQKRAADTKARASKSYLGSVCFACGPSECTSVAPHKCGANCSECQPSTAVSRRRNRFRFF